MAVRIAVLIFMAGFAASIGQILVIRELLVIFYGNELSTGLILSCWLLCTAAGSGLTGRIFRRKPPSFRVLPAGFAVFCAALPATIVWIRAARTFWSIPAGELLSPGMMLAVAFCATAPLCFFSGGLFAVAWELYRSGAKSGRRSIFVYLAESLGGCVGGLVFYFILLPLYPSFAGSLCVVVFLLIIALAAGAGWKYSGTTLCAVFVASISIVAYVLFSYADRVDFLTHRLLWGKRFLEARDTPYHNLVFLLDSGQFSLFSNGLWLFSSPDPQSAEPAAHLPLLEHPNPETVLVIGDYSPELPSEILKHPGITSIDCIQPDAELTRFTEAILPLSHMKTRNDPRVHVRHIDPRRLEKGDRLGYDVVLLSAGEPVNAEMNRFYTVEFFSRIKSLMNAGGQFSFGVPASPDIIGPREAVLLKSLYGTLREVFGNVLVVPDESVRFIASQDGRGVTKDPQILIDRMHARGIDLKYVRDFYLLDLFNPIRMAYMESIIREGPPAKINRDFEPVCYLYGLSLWGAQLHPAIGRFLGFFFGTSGLEDRGRLPGSPDLPVPNALPPGTRLTEPRSPGKAAPGGLECAVIFAAVFLAFVLLLRAKGSYSLAVAFNTGVCGAVLIIVEVVLLLVYQVMEGSVYRQMALLISLFMAGLAAGSASLMSRRGGGARRLVIIQVGLAAYLGVLYVLFSVIRSSVLDKLGHNSTLLLFSALAFVAGMFGGGQFFAAVSAGRRAGARHDGQAENASPPGSQRPVPGSPPSEGAEPARPSLCRASLDGGDKPESGQPADGADGAGLYAADLIGASSGALCGSLFLIPLFGIPKTLLVIAFGCLAGAGAIRN